MDEARGIVAAAVGETIATELVSGETGGRAMRVGAWGAVCAVRTVAVGWESPGLFLKLTGNRADLTARLSVWRFCGAAQEISSD